MRCAALASLASLALASLALVALAGTASAQQLVGQKEVVFTLSEKIADGGTVRIFSPMGDITITESSGSTMEFRGEKELLRGNPEDIAFVVRRDGSSITVCAVYNSDDECDNDGVHSDSHRGWRDVLGGNWRNRARVRITVSVPKGTHVRTSTGNGALSVNGAFSEARVASGNGRVRVVGVNGRVDASSGNGTVTVATTNGPVNASSGNGDIIVSMDRITGDGDMILSSGNGRIEVELPADFSAEIDARSGHGGVTTDFPITLNGRWSANALHGTIGKGGRRLKMSTGNGSMEIRKKA